MKKRFILVFQVLFKLRVNTHIWFYYDKCSIKIVGYKIFLIIKPPSIQCVEKFNFLKFNVENFNTL